MSLGVGRAGNGNNDTARIEAFSDGGFAIAITLLVLEIRVQRAEVGASLFDALLGLWPSYLAYAISFLQIGVLPSKSVKYRMASRSVFGQFAGLSMP